MPLSRRLIAEVLGTFWLVFGGCGSAVLAAKVILTEGTSPINIGIGLVGVSLAFGLTVLTMAYAVGHISGCHLNPAVSVGLAIGRRFSMADVGPYILAQVLGGLAGAFVLSAIAHGAPGYVMGEGAGAFATNGYADLSPGKYTMVACLLAEVVLTFVFLMIILGATDARAPQGFAPLAIGFGLTLIHLIGIPITNLSVNPARSTGPAVVVGLLNQHWQPLTQLWLFWVAPIVGAALAGVVYPMMAGEAKKV